MSDYEAFELFKKNVYKKTGINLDQYKEKQMKRRLTTLMNKRGFSSYNEYWKHLLQDSNMYREFLDRITINVSEFFRNPQRWEVLENHILPQLIKNKPEGLKVWSAACSTGEEPYSLAMVLSNYYSLDKVKILATDLDEQVLQKAREGLYSQERIKETSKHYLNKYFKVEGTLYRVDENIKRCVTFQKHNLLKDNFDKGFDLILCRNVMIYFTEDAKKTLYKKFYDALTYGGVLFVGSTEQIFDAGKLGFKSIATFFYQK